MPNKNYRKGYQKEHRTKHKLLAEGFDIAQRTAGSHSPFDVIAIDKICKVIKLVQCKPKSMSENAKRKIEEENKKLNGLFRVEFIVE